jgi:hypothetical protein
MGQPRMGACSTTTLKLQQVYNRKLPHYLPDLVDTHLIHCLVYDSYVAKSY